MGMDLPMMKKMKELEEENRRLKKMYAEVCMDKEVLQEIIEKALKPDENENSQSTPSVQKTIQFVGLAH